MDDQSLTMPTRLLLFSPAIGVSRFAVMTNVTSLLAPIPGLEKAAWLDVVPEYDPFKYNSFPVNAAGAGLGPDAGARGRPRAGAGTRHAGSDADGDRVPVAGGLDGHGGRPRHPALRTAAGEGHHELVVFDVNRNALLSGLIAPGPKRAFDEMERAAGVAVPAGHRRQPQRDSREVVEWTREPGSREKLPKATGLDWPDNVFSLGHLAVPTPIDDPMYGLRPRPAPDGLALPLGRGAPSGEAGALVLPLGQFARLRSNPFFPVIVDRIDAAVKADAP